MLLGLKAEGQVSQRYRSKGQAYLRPKQQDPVTHCMSRLQPRREEMGAWPSLQPNDWLNILLGEGSQGGGCFFPGTKIGLPL